MIEPLCEGIPIVSSGRLPNVDTQAQAELTPKLKRGYRWKADYLTSKATIIRDVVATLTDPAIADLIRRGEESSENDGFGRGGQAERVSGEGMGEGGPTVGAAFANMTCDDCDGRGWTEVERHHCDTCNRPYEPRRMIRQSCKSCAGRGHTRLDPTDEALDELFTSLVEMAGHAAIIERRRNNVMKAADMLRGRISELVQCRACHRDVACTTADPNRAGYCSACSTRWYEWWNESKSLIGANRPLEMQRFEAQRPKHEDHNERACLLCADPIYKRAKPS